MVQHLSLDAAAITICKLYDDSNKRFKKHTIPALMAYLENHFTDNTCVGRVDARLLIALGVFQADANNLVAALRKDDTFAAARADMLKKLHSLIPACDRCKPLKQIFLYRNKVAAHQEQLTESLAKRLEYLPSLGDMQSINQWASDFCELSVTVLSLTETFVPSVISARMAALNVVAKVLGKHFDPSTGGTAYQDYEEFYKKT